MPALPMSARDVARDLGDRIRGGEYGPPNSPLPRYEDLAELYSVGMTTIAKVVLILKLEGLVVAIQGKGMFVGPAAERKTRS